MPTIYHNKLLSIITQNIIIIIITAIYGVEAKIIDLNLPLIG